MDEPAALVTHGTEPIAQAIARELHRRHWNIVLQGQDRAPIFAAAERVAAAAAAPPSARPAGEEPAAPPAGHLPGLMAGPPAGQVLGCAADLNTPQGREELIEFMLEQFGRIDLLVWAPTGPPLASPQAGEDLLELPPEHCQKALETQVLAPLALVQSVANEMVRMIEGGDLDGGKIVLLNSLAATAMIPDRPLASLTAAAGAVLAQLFAQRLAEHGINVFELRTGLVSAGQADPLHARYDQRVADGLTPIRRLGRPQDIALAVAAIADDLLPYTTGQVLHVDGGLHLRRL